MVSISSFLDDEALHIFIDHHVVFFFPSLFRGISPFCIFCYLSPTSAPCHPYWFVDVVRVLNNSLEFRITCSQSPILWFISFSSLALPFDKQSLVTCIIYLLKWCGCPCAGMCTGMQVRMEARRGYRALWKWNYRQLRAACLVCWESHLGPLEEQTALNCSATSPTLARTLGSSTPRSGFHGFAFPSRFPMLRFVWNVKRGCSLSSLCPGLPSGLPVVLSMWMNCFHSGLFTPWGSCLRHLHPGSLTSCFHAW